MKEIERTISFSRGEGYLPHTDRTEIAKNVDESRTKDNIMLVNESLQEAYTKIFGEAQEKYNAKQKRKDRKIDDYFAKLFGVSASDESANAVLTSTNKQQSFYEWVVGVGSGYDTAIVDWTTKQGQQIKAKPMTAQLIAECLQEYINGNEEVGLQSYQKRNPNFHLVKAVIHMDETTPHLHIDVVPFADEYKKGMTRQQGISKALEAMGYGADDMAIAKWQAAERAILREICERNEIKIKQEEQGRGLNIPTQMYKQLAGIQEEMQINSEIIEQQRQKIQKNDEALSKQEKTKKEITAIEKQKAEAQTELDKLTAQTKSKRSELDELITAARIPETKKVEKKNWLGKVEVKEIPKTEEEMELERTAQALRFREDELKKREAAASVKEEELKYLEERIEITQNANNEIFQKGKKKGKAEQKAEDDAKIEQLQQIIAETEKNRSAEDAILEKHLKRRLGYGIQMAIELENEAEAEELELI